MTLGNVSSTSTGYRANLANALAGLCARAGSGPLRAVRPVDPVAEVENNRPPAPNWQEPKTPASGGKTLENSSNPEVTEEGGINLLA